VGLSLAPIILVLTIGLAMLVALVCMGILKVAGSVSVAGCKSLVIAAACPLEEVEWEEGDASLKTL